MHLRSSHTLPIRLARGLSAAAVLALLTACASTQPAGVQVNDTRIHAEIKARLAADSDTNPFEIGVNVNEGTVHLTGVVDDHNERSEAERIARSVDGVRRVINDLKIGDQTAGERLDDGAITAKVKAKIAASPELNPFNIQVTTVDGEVSLTGRVNSQAEKREAERLARGTDGVRGVKNLLEVGDMTGR